MNDVINLAKKIISIPSVDGNVKGMEEVMETCGKVLKDYPFIKFQKNGFKSRLYYNSKDAPKEFRLLLNAHLDVVPGKPKQFKPLIKGEKMFGRGAYDMKGAASVFTVLFSKLAKNLPFSIGLQLVTDEEVGGFNGTGLQTNKGIRSKFVIAGEPTDMLINNQAKGVLWIEFDIRGKTSHAAYPWEGDNAIIKAIGLVNFLMKSFPPPNTEIWETTCSISKIVSANDAINITPDRCKVTVDIRYVPSDLKRVKDIIAKCINQDISVRYLEKSDASFANKNNKDIINLKKSLKKAGLAGDLIKKHGSSDVRFYNSLGMEGVTIGPQGAGLHNDNEWVSLKSLSTYYNVMNDFLNNTK